MKKNCNHIGVKFEGIPCSEYRCVACGEWVSECYFYENPDQLFDKKLIDESEDCPNKFDPNNTGKCICCEAEKDYEESEEGCEHLFCAWCGRTKQKCICKDKPKQKIEKLELNDDSYLISKTTMKIAIEIGKEYGAEKASDIIFRALFRSH